MTLAPHVHSHFEEHERRYGHPASPLPLAIREAYAAAGIAVPAERRMLSIITPPPPGNCAHCGVSVPAKQHLRAHAVAGFEDATHHESGEPLRMLVTHCNECIGREACSRDAITPGCGLTNAPGGYCEPLTREEVLGISLFPGIRYLGAFLKLALASVGVVFAAGLAIQTSQGQQQANLGGPLANLIVPGDATSGHGFNAGLLRVLSSSAPATANAAETGTLLISWTMPATAFGAASAALPSVTTANAISNVAASATGTAGYGRLVEVADSGFGLSTSLRRFQFSVGAGSGDMSFNTLSIVSAGTCSCTSLTITHGA